MSNYYLALGIDKGADLHKIKKAYRFYCKKYHPDTADDEQKNQFLKIQEAYDTLSDAEKRRKYDRRIGGGDNKVPVNFVDPDFWEEKKQRDRYIRRFSSSIDDFWDSFVTGLFEDDFSGVKELYIELILSPEEAQRGGNIPIEIPVIETCGACSGRGYVGRFICTSCSGNGIIHGKREIELHVPAGIASGAEAKVSLAGIGAEGVDLHIDILVG